MTESNDAGSAPGNPQPPKPTVWQVTKSVLAGALGVQKDSNREADFQASSPWPYIIGGLIFTVLFIVTLVTIVSFVIP